MKDFTYLELVDLDPTPLNRIVNIYYPQRKELLRCPHNIITRIANVARSHINERLQVNNTESLVDDDFISGYPSNDSKSKTNDKDDTKIQFLLNSHQNLLSLLNEIKEKIEKLEEKIEKI